MNILSLMGGRTPIKPLRSAAGGTAAQAHLRVELIFGLWVTQCASPPM